MRYRLLLNVFGMGMVVFIMVNSGGCGKKDSGPAAPTGHSLTVWAFYPDNTPRSAFTLGLSGAATGTESTNSSGFATFDGLANGDYVVTPLSLSSYTFSPASISATILDADERPGTFTVRRLLQQSSLDSDLVWAVNGSVNDIYNQNVAGDREGISRWRMPAARWAEP